MNRYGYQDSDNGWGPRSSKRKSCGGNLFQPPHGRGLIQSANAPIFGLDMDLNVVRWNSWLVERCGMSLAELQGKAISTVLSQRSKKTMKDRTDVVTKQKVMMMLDGVPEIKKIWRKIVVPRDQTTLSDRKWLGSVWLILCLSVGLPICFIYFFLLLYLLALVPQCLSVSCRSIHLLIHDAS